MAIDAAVFDWDGTIVDTMPAVLRANTAVLAEHGLVFDLVRFRAAYAPDWRIMYRRLGVPAGRIESAGERWLELYRADVRIAPFPGAVAALRRLAGAGIHLALVTAGHREVVEAQLAAVRVLDLFEVRVCGDDDVRSKPHPEPLLRALGVLGVGDRPDRTAYVGDAPDDMRMAAAVGALGVGIEGVLGGPAELVMAGASTVHASVADWVDAILGVET